MSHLANQALLQALSDGALKGAGNATIFKRGQAYAQSDAVQAVEQEEGPVPAARATVVGTQPCEVEVWVDKGAVGGQCDCPNAEDGWFCKHQVALAMVWRGLLGGDVPAPDGTARAKVCIKQRWGEALALVQPPARCQPSTLRALARNLGKEHQMQRIELLRRVLAQAMLTATSPYGAELKLVEEICGLLDATRRLAWLASLRAEFKAKRNVVAGLPAG